MNSANEFKPGHVYEMTQTILNPAAPTDRRRHPKSWVEHGKIHKGERFVVIPSYQYNGRLALVPLPYDNALESVEELGCFESKIERRAALFRAMLDALEPVPMDLATTLRGAAVAYGTRAESVLLSLAQNGKVAEADVRAELQERTDKALKRWHEVNAKELAERERERAARKTTKE